MSTKTIIFSFLFSLAGILNLSAQQQKPTPVLPLDDVSKLITYSKAQEIAGQTAGQLYQKAISWAGTYYKNPTDVIREKDSVGGKIVCKARFKISNPADKKGVASDAGLVQYTLTLQFKEGKYKYTLTEINWKQTSYYPAEKWMDKTNSYYKPEYDFYLQQVDEQCHEILKDLDKGMRMVAAQKKDDW
ncbi:hypothetical protein BH11BAC2_BH11BAC2_04730 [soil metagenome]